MLRYVALLYRTTTAMWNPVASTLTKMASYKAIFVADCISSSSFILYSAGNALYTSLFTLQQMRQLKRLRVLLSELRLMSFVLMTSRKKQLNLRLLFEARESERREKAASSRRETK